MGKTLPADDVPETPCRSSFRYRGQTVVVTMTTPSVRPNTIPMDAPYFWPTAHGVTVETPTIVPGFIGAATFTVTGLAVPVEFGTGLDFRPGPPATYTISISYVLVDTSTTLAPSLDIPLAALTRAAVQASTARAVLLPKNYKALMPNSFDPTTWVATDADRPPAGVPMITTDDFPAPFPIHVGPLSAEEDAALLARLFGTGRPRRSAITDDVLRETADVYRNATSDPRLAVATYFQVSPSTARERIRKARERGLLEDIPDTDGRKARRKGS